MLNLPIITQQKLQVNLRTEILEELELFVSFAKQEGESHATVDNVVTYMVEKYFSGSTSDQVAYRKWVAQASQREAEASARKAEGLLKAKRLLARRAEEARESNADESGGPTKTMEKYESSISDTSVV